MNKRIETLKKVIKTTTKEKPMTVKEIVYNMQITKNKQGLFLYTNYKSRQLRLDVQEIRRNNLFGKYWVVSGNFGYYLTSNIKDIIKWQKRYESYIIDMAKTLRGLKKRPEFFNHKFNF